MTTTSSPSEPGAAVASGAADALPELASDERVKIKGPLRKLLLWLLPANLGVFILWGAIPGFLLQKQIQGIETDPTRALASITIVSVIGAFAAMVAQPVAGTISDRTRSRFGRRAPWMVLGALVGGLALIGMALANEIVYVAIAWTMVQIAFNFVQGPLSAILPDRVPVRARGTFAALAGAAAMLGAVGGQVIGASFANAIGAGYVTLAGVAVIAITLFVVFNPDKSSKDQVNPPFKFIDFIRTFWINPIKYPDFFWAFTGRLLLYTGYFAVTGFNLLILQNYIGLGDGADALFPVLGLLGLAGMIPTIIISGPISDRVGRRKIFVFLSSLIVGLGLLIPLMLPTVEGMMLMAVVTGIGFGAFQSVDQALVTEVLPSANSYAKDLGVVNIAATLPQTLAPGVAGAIVLSFGYAGLFPVAITLSVLGAFAVFMIKSVK